MPSQYRHRPLSSPRSIRTLECKKRAGSTTNLDGFDFGLLEGSLDDSTTFYALSYAWGEATPTDSILCEEANMPITANCAAALKHILPKFKSCNIWVDSICIDQTCILERNQQVALMGEIYSSAQEVLIWLGDGNEMSHRIHQQLESIGIAFKHTSNSILEDPLEKVQGMLPAYIAIAN